MSESVTYVQVVKTDSGKYVYEARDAAHNVVETSKQYGKEADAHQAGADAYGHVFDESVLTRGLNPATGQMEEGPLLVSLGVPVRHAVVNDGAPEYGEGDGPPEGTVQP